MGTVLPARLPEPSAYGLLNSRTLVDESLRWQSGFEQESFAHHLETRLLSTCVGGSGVTAVPDEGMTSLGEYTPFTVMANVHCSTLGGIARDWEDRALNALELSQSKAIELEFWEGRRVRADNAVDTGANTNRYLADGNAVDLTPAGGPVKIHYGLALLEGALASAGAGGRGFIHSSRTVAAAMAVHSRADDDVLRTKLGNYVIAGEGYTGTGTNGAAPAGTTQWLYATGPVYVRLDEPFLQAPRPQYIDTSTNTISVTAERMASVVWDGTAHFKIQVDISLDYA